MKPKCPANNLSSTKPSWGRTTASASVAKGLYVALRNLGEPSKDLVLYVGGIFARNLDRGLMLQSITASVQKYDTMTSWGNKPRRRVARDDFSDFLRAGRPTAHLSRSDDRRHHRSNLTHHYIPHVRASLARPANPTAPPPPCTARRDGPHCRLYDFPRRPGLAAGTTPRAFRSHGSVGGSCARGCSSPGGGEDPARVAKEDRESGGQSRSASGSATNVSAAF